MEQVYWCLHCERTSTRHQLVYDNELGFSMCNQDDCDGGPMDLWEWEKVVECNPEYPLVPQIGRVYPLYPSKWDIQDLFKTAK